MITPDTGTPLITEYYYGGATSGWNDGSWNERITTSPVPFAGLHNFAPILISNGTTNLTFNLCGNGYFYGVSGTGITFWAEVIIANCEQFYQPSGGSVSGIEYNRVFNDTDNSIDVSDDGLVCFDFTGTYSIPTACQYHAAVGLVVVSDQVGTQKFDFSYQLRVSQ
jgi:hypothetical protein